MKSVFRLRPQFWLAIVLLAIGPYVHAQSRLVTGKRITPVGINQEIGSLPMNMILSPNGKFAITSDMGFHEAVWSISTATK
jgi:hypothetical protein